MKTVFLSLFAVSLCLSTINAATLKEQGNLRDSDPDYSISERGANHRIWTKTVREMDGGRMREKIHTYTELTTGMHYQQDGQWVESEAKIEITKDGAAATKGPHKVNFAPNINTVEAITLTLPDGQLLRSHVLGLSYYDSATGKSALIGEIKDSIGVLTPPNRIVYQDAFTDLKADIRYTYTKAGFEQDIILREQIASPAEYGLNPETTRLEVLTEFINPPAPVTEAKQLKNGDPDVTLAFGSMRIATGKAFSLGETNGLLSNRSVGTIPVQKIWTRMEGRDFLIEAIPYDAARAGSENLPKPEAKVDKNVRQARVGATRKLPMIREAKSRSEKLRVASLTNERPGFLIDYLITLVGSEADYVFKGDTTYFINGELDLYGTTTFEGGTVIKFSDSDAWVYSFDGLFDCKTDTYRPAVFTSKDDDSVGEIVSGSTGSPVSYFGTALDIQTGSPTLSNLRFLYNSGFTISLRGDVASAEFDNVQFVNCWSAIESFSPTVTIRNGLFVGCPYPLFGANYSFLLENVTIDGCTQLSADWDGGEYSSVYFTNCIGISLTNLGQAAIISTNYSYLTTNYVTGIFQTVGAASCYLANNSPYRNAGTTNISANLLANIRSKTTYPPIVYSNATLSAVTTLGPQAQRDTDVPDLGYHYDPLDYVFGGAQANENLTFTTGTAVGWFWPSTGSFGLNLGDQKVADFQGTQKDYNYWVKYNTVQEGANGLWAIGYGIGGLTGTANQYLEDVGLSPEVRMRFTRCSMLADAGFSHFRDNYGYLTVRALNCEFLGGAVGGYGTGYYLTNSLFNRASAGIIEGWPGNEFHLRNCTFYGGSLQITPWYAQIPASVKDCAFDGTTINTSYYRWDEDLQDYVEDLSSFDFDYNAFLSGGNQTNPQGTHNVTVTNFVWQSSWLGNFYLRTNSPLINVGSLTNAGLAGLYHFTMTTNQVKETNSIVDIGYHYVAVTNGIPIDSDSDGVPDYQEDYNGNGILDSGETSITNALDYGLKVLITQPKNGSTIP